MIGNWQMIYQTVSPLFKDKSLFFANYQIFQFFEDGYVKNVASKKRLQREDISSLLERLPKSTAYSFVDDGQLIIERSNKNFDNMVVSIAVDDLEKALRSGAPLLKKGDLVVSYFDGNKNLYMQRYLRRLD